MRTPLIECRDVSFAYEGKVVLEDLNFQVQDGDCLCVVGENGAGKSTLVRGLLRLIAPKSGEIQIRDDVKLNQIGYLPQRTEVRSDFPASCFEVALSGRLGARGALPFYSRKDRRVAEESLRRIDAWDLRLRRFGELSGGQRQRVLLARALCASDKALLLDEPVAGLDPLVTQELYRVIRALNRESGMTIVMISHDIRGAARIASHILHLNGKQAFFGAAEAYRASDIGRAFEGGEGDDH